MQTSFWHKEKKCKYPELLSYFLLNECPTSLISSTCQAKFQPTNVSLLCNSHGQNSHYSPHTLSHIPRLIFSHSSALLSGWYFPYGNIRVFFFPILMVYSDTSERHSEREGGRMKRETEWGTESERWGTRVELFLARLGVSHTHVRSRFWGLLLLRVVGVRGGWVLIWFDFALWEVLCLCVDVCICVCVHVCYLRDFPAVAMVSDRVVDNLP